jgi:hypothetical protein
MKSLIQYNIRKRKIEILKKLDKILNGKCDTSIFSCPLQIDRTLPIRFDNGPTMNFAKGRKNVWRCNDCVTMFIYSVDLEKTDIDDNPCCPCIFAKNNPTILSPDEVVYRVTEYIEELKEINRKNKPNIFRRVLMYLI